MIFSRGRMIKISALIVLAFLNEANILDAHELAQAPHNNSSDAPHIATESNLTSRYKQFEETYAQTLMNSSFLPFIAGCSAIMKKSISASQLEEKDQFLCLTYFDMINHLIVNLDQDFIQLNKVNTSLNDYDNATLVKNFCEFFGGELPTVDVDRPFVTKMMANQINWTNAMKIPDNCKIICYFLDEFAEFRISPICKLISGGYRLIKKHSMDAKNPSEVDVLEAGPIQTQSKSRNISMGVIYEKTKVDNQVMPKAQFAATPSNTSQSTTKVKNQVLADATVGANTINSSFKSPEEARKKTSPMTKDPAEAVMKEEKNDFRHDEVKQNGNTNPEETDANEENGDALEDNKENIDGFDDKSYISDETDNQPLEEINKTKQKYVDDQTKLKSQNIEGSESSNGNTNSNNNVNNDALFDDTDSNFFSYLMFLMLITIVFYIVYHNKTKVLALVIEGRRGRSGYSRSSSRRKHHSAEYRKLDSNLEEAIQSNDQVLTTQIIY